MWLWTKIGWLQHTCWRHDWIKCIYKIDKTVYVNTFMMSKSQAILYIVVISYSVCLSQRISVLLSSVHWHLHKSSHTHTLLVLSVKVGLFYHLFLQLLLLTVQDDCEVSHLQTCDLNLKMLFCVAVLI